MNETLKLKLIVLNRLRDWLRPMQYPQLIAKFLWFQMVLQNFYTSQIEMQGVAFLNSDFKFLKRKKSFLAKTFF